MWDTFSSLLSERLQFFPQLEGCRKPDGNEPLRSARWAGAVRRDGREFYAHQVLSSSSPHLGGQTSGSFMCSFEI